MKYWSKLPALLQGLIIGLLIQVLGVMPLTTLIQWNITIVPMFPWALFVGVFILFVFWRYLTGRRFIFKASFSRSDLSRTGRIPRHLIVPSFITGGLLSLTLICFSFLGYMMGDVPLRQIEILKVLQSLPIQTSISLLFFVSLLSGVIEELAWRGYAQRILEKKYSKFVSISVVAIGFTAIHFLPLFMWPLFIIGSLGWGYLAVYSRSILPNILVHTAIDLTILIWAFYNLDIFGEILEYNIFQDGINTTFIILGISSIAFTSLTFISLLSLKKLQGS